MRGTSQFSYAPVAWQQARKSEKHGFLVESLGKRLQERNDNLTQSSGQIVEECGKFIQHKAQESLMYTELSEIPGVCSRDLYKQVIQAQVDARKSYIQALKTYTQVVQKTLKKIEKHLQYLPERRTNGSKSDKISS